MSLISPPAVLHSSGILGGSYDFNDFYVSVYLSMCMLCACVRRPVSSENSTQETVLSSHLMVAEPCTALTPHPTWQLRAILTPALLWPSQVPGMFVMLILQAEHTRAHNVCNKWELES